jgi:NAD(P)-dependent dehydrogenase (short-subunit alcohol dehydrogenase family)
MNKKTIFITGAASGIGRETAILFAKKGWFVGIVDLDKDGLSSLESEIGKDNCFMAVMDVTESESVKVTIEAFGKKTGNRMDVLDNNAGIIKFGAFEDVSLEMHHKIANVNFNGCLNCIYYSLKLLKQTPGSRIINMSSASSLYGIPDFSVYSATKHALSAMTESLNLELGKYGIFVCDLKPPFVNTPLLELDEEVFSIKKMGINLEAPKVALTVWEAAHRNKLHWKIGATRALSYLFWLMPFAKRFVVKTLALPKQ